MGGGRQWAEERLWEVQLKVAAAFRHHTLWGWGVGSQHILPAARWEWRCMVSPPLMKAGRQRDQSCQNHSRSCFRKLSAGLLWALRANGPSSTGLHPGLPASGEYSLQEILCSPHRHLNAWHPRAADRPAPLQEVTRYSCSPSLSVSLHSPTKPERALRYLIQLGKHRASTL